MNNFEKIIKQIIIDAKLDDMPEDFLAEYQQKLSEEAQKSMGIAAMKALSEDQIAEFNQLVQSGPEDTGKIQAFLQENIDGYEELMVKTLTQFREQVIASAEKLRQQ